METIGFISTETGTDLIVSFAIVDQNDPTDIESLTLMRTPKYEPLLDDYERGVKVCFGADDEELLEGVTYDEEAAVVHLKTIRAGYDLDVRRVDRRELRAMCRVLRRMNFDGRVQLSGV